MGWGGMAMGWDGHGVGCKVEPQGLGRRSMQAGGTGWWVSTPCIAHSHRILGGGGCTPKTGSPPGFRPTHPTQHVSHHKSTHPPSGPPHSTCKPAQIHPTRTTHPPSGPPGPPTRVVTARYDRCVLIFKVPQKLLATSGNPTHPPTRVVIVRYGRCVLVQVVPQKLLAPAVVDARLVLLVALVPASKTFGWIWVDVQSGCAACVRMCDARLVLLVALVPGREGWEGRLGTVLKRVAVLQVAVVPGRRGLGWQVGNVLNRVAVPLVALAPARRGWAGLGGF